MRGEEALVRLTTAQRRVLCELPSDGQFVDAYRYCRQRRTRIALHNLGVTEPFRRGPVTEWFRIRPTPLGMEVRALIANTPTRD